MVAVVDVVDVVAVVAVVAVIAVIAVIAVLYLRIDKLIDIQLKLLDKDDHVYFLVH